jgi:hypothetical protein
LKSASALKLFSLILSDWNLPFDRYQFPVGKRKRADPNESQPFFFCFFYLANYSLSAPVKLSGTTLIAADSLLMMHSILPKYLGYSEPMKNWDDRTLPL